MYAGASIDTTCCVALRFTRCRVAISNGYFLWLLATVLRLEAAPWWAWAGALGRPIREHGGRVNAGLCTSMLVDAAGCLARRSAQLG